MANTNENNKGTESLGQIMSKWTNEDFLHILVGELEFCNPARSPGQVTIKSGDVMHDILVKIWGEPIPRWGTHYR